ncbi:MAG: Gmad2 immunoglobulin-like domain-containing protein [Nocardioides sp.]
MTSPTTRFALAGALAAVVLAGCSNDAPDNTAADPNPPAPSSSAPQSPSESDPTSAPPTESAEPADKTTVPVYFVGETPQGPKLFREFRKVEADNPLEEAAALMVAGDAIDDDYGTLFPAGGFESVTFSEGAGAFVVQLPDDGWKPPGPGMSKAQARLAVQQLVYTVQGVGQSRSPVLVQLGNKATTLFGIDTGDGLKQAAQLDVLGLVNVTSPEEGATVSGSFTATGVASSFEATVPWEIRKGGPDGKVVRDGFATAAGWIDKLYPFETEVDVSGLAPGDYSFVAMTDDPSGGEGGGPTEDSKTITVE